MSPTIAPVTYHGHGCLNMSIIVFRKYEADVDPKKLYTICGCEREGDPPNMLCRLMNVADPQNTPFQLHQVVKEYLKAHSPVSPLPERNAVILDAPQTLLTQVTGVNYTFK